MRTSKTRGLKRLAALMGAAVLASAIMVPAAFAYEDPYTDGENAAEGTSSAKADSEFYLYLVNNKSTVSITAPAKIYMAGDLNQVTSENRVVDFIVPTADAVKITNNGAAAEVTGWTTSAVNGKVKTDTDNGFYKNASTLADSPSKDMFYLQATPNSSTTAVDLAVSSSALTQSNWQMAKGGTGATGNTISLALEGKVYDPTEANELYLAKSPIAKVTWTFKPSAA